MTTKLLLALGLCAFAAACAPPTPSASANANTPGWTGSTVVLGNTSTAAGDTNATYRQQKWGYSLHP
jgi:hypothetical protein